MKKKTRRKTTRSNKKQPYNAIFDAVFLSSKIHSFDACEEVMAEAAVLAIRRYCEDKGRWWKKFESVSEELGFSAYEDVIDAIAFRINNGVEVPDNEDQWYAYLCDLVKDQALNRLRRYTAIIRNDLLEDPQVIELNASCPDAAIGQAESKLNKGRKREDRESISSDCVLVEGGKVVPHNIESWD